MKPGTNEWKNDLRSTGEACGEPCNSSVYVMLEHIDKLQSALHEAVKLIEFYHGEPGWSEYQQSPEMKRLKAVMI